ncbi:MAG: hypothetical protein ABIU54_08755, partial [Candidatus Eisenbacteria bacterium]
MSDDLRQEAASIARALRRHVERERSLGGGELLALGVAKARAKGITQSDAGTAVAVSAPVTVVEVSAPPPAAALPAFAQPLNASALGGGRDAIVAASQPLLQIIAAEACA